MTENKNIEQARKTAKEFLTILAETDKDNPAKQDVAELRDFLHEHPKIWGFVGNLAEKAAHNLINSIESTSPLKESLKIGYLQLQKDLGGDRATKLEKLLIEQVVLSWMRLNLVEYNYTAVMNQTHPLKRGEYWEKRLNAAQRRFLRACTTLARIRKIGLPALQINIADQQVNQVNP